MKDPAIEPTVGQDDLRRQRWRRKILGGTAVMVLISTTGFLLRSPATDLFSPHAPVENGSAQNAAPIVGYQAPAFETQTLDGKQVRLADFRGQPVFINFWAKWCAPCRTEMRHIQELSQQYRNRGLVVLAISVDVAGSEDEIRAYVQTGSPEVGSYTFPILLDPHRKIAQAYKLFGLPISFFIDNGGIIRVLHPGGMSRAVMLENIKTILPEWTHSGGPARDA